MSGLTDLFGLFDRYLDGHADHPVGVAVSGGGDSVALLYLMAQWGRRPLHVFCVDHGINPSSADWTRCTARHAEAVKADFTALHWTDEKPATGLSAAARAARHTLLADAARSAGLRVLCLAHTADDIAEALLMREQGASVGAPALWNPSPAWPGGRGVFLFRPLLGERRDDLRDWLRARGLSWIDDPANDSPVSLRARARKALAGRFAVPEIATGCGLPDVTCPSPFAAFGLVGLDPDRLLALPRDQALRILSAAAVCAGGRDRLPRRDGVERALDAVSTGRTMTLGGARIEGGTLTRDFGDIGRNGQPEVQVKAGCEVVWDGRFVIAADRSGIVRPSGMVRTDLPQADRNTLMALPAPLRAVMPAIDFGRGPILALPLSADHCETVRSRCLVLPRFKAATGTVTRESDLATDV